MKATSDDDLTEDDKDTVDKDEQNKNDSNGCKHYTHETNEYLHNDNLSDNANNN